MFHKLIISLIAPLLVFPLLTSTPKVDKPAQINKNKTIKAAPAWESINIVKVYDGDTFTATRNGELIRVRVTWTDTPELKLKEFYSQEAKEILANALAKNDAEIQVVGKSFDRLVAHVRTKKIKNVGFHMVQQGAGKAYPTCQTKCPETWAMVRNAEAIAKRSQMGMWLKEVIDLNLNIAEV